MTKCQRCQEKPGFKWDGTGGFTLLCGGCKFRVCFENPKFKERIEKTMKEAMLTVMDKPEGKQ